jgi:hypothetical protein
MIDSRLHFYGLNQQKIPEIGGDIIPDFMQSEAEYKRCILEPMYKAIKPYDPQGILQYEWLNSRAVIPKFDYNALEIRIIDCQECPAVDIAIALAVQSILKNWCLQSDYFLKHPYDTTGLKTVYDSAVYKGFRTKIDDAELYRQWQLPPGNKSIANIWSLLLERFCPDLDSKSQRILEQILIQGSLSERILRACKDNPRLTTIKNVYRQLGSCLLNNQPFNLL